MNKYIFLCAVSMKYISQASVQCHDATGKIEVKAANRGYPGHHYTFCDFRRSCAASAAFNKAWNSDLPVAWHSFINACLYQFLHVSHSAAG